MFLVGLLASGVSARIWTDASGKRTVDAEYLGVEHGQVKLRFSGTGKTVLVPLGVLSEEDQRFVNEQIALAQTDREAAGGTPKPFDLAIRNDPTNPAHYVARGKARTNRGDYDHLLRIRDKPDATLYYNRGCAHLAAGRMQEAISDFSKAIILKQDWTLAYNNRGAVYARLGQFDKAITDFTKAVDSDPSNRLAYRNRALAYKKLGQPLKALADFSSLQNLEREKIGANGHE